MDNERILLDFIVDLCILCIYILYESKIIIYNQKLRTMQIRNL